MCGSSGAQRWMHRNVVWPLRSSLSGGSVPLQRYRRLRLPQKRFKRGKTPGWMLVLGFASLSIVFLGAIRSSPVAISGPPLADFPRLSLSPTAGRQVLARETRRKGLRTPTVELRSAAQLLRNSGDSATFDSVTIFVLTDTE